jgi:hypothetical protein
MPNTIGIQLIPVIITFTVTAAALLLAGYIVWRRRLFLAAICMGCFLALFNPSIAMSAEHCKPIRYADGDTFNFKRGGELTSPCLNFWRSLSMSWFLTSIRFNPLRICSSRDIKKMTARELSFLKLYL